MVNPIRVSKNLVRFYKLNVIEMTERTDLHPESVKQLDPKQQKIAIRLASAMTAVFGYKDMEYLDY